MPVVGYLGGLFSYAKKTKHDNFLKIKSIVNILCTTPIVYAWVWSLLLMVACFCLFLCLFVCGFVVLFDLKVFGGWLISFFWVCGVCFFYLVGWFWFFLEFKNLMNKETTSLRRIR